MVLLGELYSYEGMRMRVEVPCISAWETEWAWRHVLHNGRFQPRSLAFLLGGTSARPVSAGIYDRKSGVTGISASEAHIVVSTSSQSSVRGRYCPRTYSAYSPDLPKNIQVPHIPQNRQIRQSIKEPTMSDSQRNRPLDFKTTSIMIPLAVGAIALLGSIVKGHNDSSLGELDPSNIPAKAQVMDWKSWAALEKPQKQSENDGSVVSPPFVLSPSFRAYHEIDRSGSQS